MRFALLGDHPDGVALAQALAATGQHELATYCGPAAAAEVLAQAGLRCALVGDVEEVLADPAVAAVIVAGPPSARPEQLRRALQSERHVLCVHPADTRPDAAYEGAMIQADTRQLLLPLLPEGSHPGLRQLREAVGDIELLVVERWSPHRDAEPRPSLPGWEVLRQLGGEVAEVAAYAAGDELTLDAPVTVAGRFEKGGLFQCLFVPGQPRRRWRLAAHGSAGRAELVFPDGWPGPATLTWQDQAGGVQEQTWPAWDPWPSLAAAIGEQLAAFNQADRQPPTADRRWSTWQDEIRCLELDDAARQSVHRRRSSLMEYQEASEEIGFKGTMTLVGCGMLWLLLLVLILATWQPWLAIIIGPILAIFLGLQVLRWVIPSK